MVDVDQTWIGDRGTGERVKPSAADNLAPRRIHLDFDEGFKDQHLVAGVDAVAISICP